MNEIRVVIADDDPLVRVALSHFVSRDPEIVVVGEASDGAEALKAIEEHHPDIVMMDVQMPGMGGIEATEQISERFPDVRVLAVTTLDTRETVLPMLSAGATGYIGRRVALRLIEAHPTRRAGDLADMVGRERQPFKADVRKLKNLGLTQSLEIGYRLSPRGEASLRRRDAS